MAFDLTYAYFSANPGEHLPVGLRDHGVWMLDWCCPDWQCVFAINPSFEDNSPDHPMAGRDEA